MKKKHLLSVFLLISTMVYSQQREQLVLGLFWNEKPQTIIVSVRGGEYILKGDNSIEIPFKTSDMFHITVDGNKVKVKNLSTTFGSFNKVEIIEVNDTSSLNIKSSKPKMANRVYEDNFRIYSKNSRLKILNDAKLSNYVAGVVQWESGNGNTIEYYKVQAIITRTYALRNINKYESEGFNLCDRVDSQVYKGRTKNKDILKAVKESKDLVLVDDNMNLISAVFHSNSGGKTRNSEDVWTRKMPYLRAVKDTFSIGQPHYLWTKTMPTSKYLDILKTRFKVDTDNSKIRKYVTSYCPSKPQNFMFPKNNVKLTAVRSALKIRSTNFCVTPVGENVEINGKGFGHGVGLSQEGAMKMTLNGYSFEEVLAFYYKRVHLVSLTTLDYLESEE
ncbi:MAG: SpoIID/LytB domain-containing protein [Salibacteraceae bacterium]